MSTLIGSDISAKEIMSHTTLLAEAFPALVSVSLIEHLKVSKLSTASAVIVISLVVHPDVTPRWLLCVRYDQPIPSVEL